MSSRNEYDTAVEQKNAVITAATITVEDHGLLSAWITLDYDGSGQGFGGFALYAPDAKLQEPGNYCGLFIWRVLEVVGVGRWDQLVGKTIRVRATGVAVIAIGHIVKDVWFHPKDEFAKMARSAVLWCHTGEGA